MIPRYRPLIPDRSRLCDNDQEWTPAKGGRVFELCRPCGLLAAVQSWLRSWLGKARYCFFPSFVAVRMVRAGQRLARFDRNVAGVSVGRAALRLGLSRGLRSWLAAITIWGTLRVPFFGLPRSILDCFDADFCSLRLILQLFFKLFKIISTSFQISANFHDFCTVFQNSAQFRQNSRKVTDFCKIRQMLLKHLVEFCKISQILMRVISQRH